MLVKDLKVSFVLIVLFAFFTYGQYSVSDIVEEDPEEIVNKTFAQEQTDLQNFIFKTYNRRVKPVKNQSLPIHVECYIYLMHYNVDEAQQTMTLNGHMYLSWIDEVAVWDPTKFNNIRMTIAKQWELWQPDLKVANSVSGVNQFFEISRRSHATLEHISTSSTKVQTYPTFTMKIGCNFDYSAYPYDIQKCTLRMYPAARMNEVILKVYFDLPPSVLLGWEEETVNKHIGEWSLEEVDNNITYFRKRKFTSERPVTALEASRTWSIFMVYFTLKRNVALFWITMGLPAIWSSIFNICSFLLETPEHAIMASIANIFFQIIVLQDFIKELPPAVGNAPPIAKFSNALLIMTIIALVSQLMIKHFKINRSKLPPRYAEYLLITWDFSKKQAKKLKKRGQADGEEINLELVDDAPFEFTTNPFYMYQVLRTILFIIYSIVTFYLIIYYLL